MATLTCPKCGAVVTAPGMNTSVRCSYCGTNFSVPSASVGAGGAFQYGGVNEPPRVQRGATGGLVLAMMMVLMVGGMGAGFFLVARSPASPAYTSTPVATAVTAVPPVRPGTGATAAGDPLGDANGQMASALCLSSCIDACTPIKDPSAMSTCMQGCQDKCQLPKVTGAACRDRCTTRCNNAPDTASKQACSKSCNASCPP